MNSLVRNCKLAPFWLKNASPVLTAVRNHWNKDFQPAPYPKTEEERIAAAKKYGIPIQEYEPYPDDGCGVGDYPKLPMIGDFAKDPYYPYDMPELKRNFQETLHLENDLLREDRYDYGMKTYKPLWVLWLQFFGCMSFFYCLIQWGWKYPMFHSVMPPQRPEEGKVHYTFESP